MDSHSGDRILVKSPEETVRLRAACRVVAEVLAELAALVAPGVTTLQLDQAAEAGARRRGAEPAFKGYHGFPASLCASVNEEVVHGIPSATRVLRQGDIIGLDFGVVLDGFYGDAAVTVPVGAVSEEARRLLEVTRAALAAAIGEAWPDRRVGDLGAAVQRSVEPLGFAVVRDFVGHGIGRRLHEPPQIPNFGTPGTGPRLRAGMALAIEPMVNLGGFEVDTRDDGWTAFTVDGRLSAHFEHTVLVTENGPEILTLPPSASSGATEVAR
jgi:methionyl aminopeptidase